PTAAVPLILQHWDCFMNRLISRSRLFLCSSVVAMLTIVGCKSTEAPAPTSMPSQAQDEPQGGQPAPGSKQSVPDLDEQVAHQRAFEAVLWAMPASAIYRFRIGLLELPGGADNVIVATSRPITPIKEVITPNQ